MYYLSYIFLAWNLLIYLNDLERWEGCVYTTLTAGGESWPGRSIGRRNLLTSLLSRQQVRNSDWERTPFLSRSTIWNISLVETSTSTAWLEVVGQARARISVTTWRVSRGSSTPLPSMSYRRNVHWNETTFRHLFSRKVEIGEILTEQKKNFVYFFMNTLLFFWIY